MQNVISKKSKSHKKKLNGFNSSLKSSQIQILYDELIKGKYIEEYTNQTHFKAIFRNKPIPSDFIPIKKLKPFTNTLFAYFISQLFQKENPNDYWSIAESCFEAKNLKQSFSNAYKYNPNNKPRGSDRIDEILTKIYPPLQ